MKNRLSALTLTLLILLLTLGIVNALNVVVRPVRNQIPPGEELIYNVSVVNEVNESLRVSLFMLTSHSYTIEPQDFILPALGSQTSTLIIRTTNDTRLGNKAFVLYYNAGNTTKETYFNAFISLPITELVKQRSFNYTSTLKVGEPVKINLEINNTYAERKTKAEFRLFKDNKTFLEITKELVIKEGVHDYELILDLPPLFPSGVYDAELRIELLGVEVIKNSFNVQVPSYSLPVIRESEERSLLGSVKKITVINNGTAGLLNYRVNQTISLLESFLITSYGGAERVGRTLHWSIPYVPPSTYNESGFNYSSVTLSYSVTYVPLLLLPFFLGVIVLFVFILNRKIVVNKTVESYDMKSGVLNMKIRIKIRNVSLGELRNVRVVERLPFFVNAVYEFGSIKGNVDVTEGRKKLYWNINSLKKSEEVILTYKIKSRIELIGELILPPAEVYVEDRKGKVYLRKSNTITIKTQSQTLLESKGFKPEA